MAWVTPYAPTPDELDSCVTCGLCLPHCPTYRLTGDETASPRGRLTAMAAIADGIAGVDDTFEEIMGFCLQCRACEAVCPSLVPFGRAMEGARAELTVQRPTPSRRFRHFVVGRLLASRRMVALTSLGLIVVQALRLDRLRLAGARRLRGLRRLPIRRDSPLGRSFEPYVDEVGTAALLAGCVMDPWFGGVHQATIELLRLGGYRVVVPAAQSCCGALAAHDGAASYAGELAEKNVGAFREADLVVVNSAGCGAHLKEYGHWAEGGDELASRVKDVTEVCATLLEAGRLPRLHDRREQVAVQDPCHLRHAQRITEQPRLLLKAAGYEPVDIDARGLCCGAAGIYTLLRPHTAADLGSQKASQVIESRVTLVASANPGCELQLRSHLPRGYSIRHPVEFYWSAAVEAGLVGSASA